MKIAIVIFYVIIGIGFMFGAAIRGVEINTAVEAAVVWPFSAGLILGDAFERGQERTRSLKQHAMEQ